MFAELARDVGSIPHAFNLRMKTAKFSTEEMDKIAAALEADYYWGSSSRTAQKSTTKREQPLSGGLFPSAYMGIGFGSHAAAAFANTRPRRIFRENPVYRNKLIKASRTLRRDSLVTTMSASTCFVVLSGY